MNAIPGLKKFLLVFIVPFQDMPQSSFGKRSLNDSGFDIYCNLILPIYSMKMRWWMFPGEDTNDDS